MSSLLEHFPLLQYAWTAIVFLLMLTVLVAAHELGHYLFARLFGMGVEEFAIGMFGKKPLLRYLRRTYRIPIKPGQDPNRVSKSPTALDFEGGGYEHRPGVLVETANGPALEETTDFTIRPWPVGGFVRIKGMVPEEDGGEVNVVGGFYSKPPWQRLIVLFAGPLFSVLAGVIVMIPIFMSVGAVETVNEPVIKDMIKDKPAYNAGMRPDDRILSIDGDKISTFYQMLTHVRDSAGKPLKFTFLDKGKVLTRTVVPYLEERPTPVLGPDLEMTGELKRQGLMGILRPQTLVRLSFWDSVERAVRVPITTVVGLFDSVKNPSTLQDTVGGPGTMLKATSDAVQFGFVSVADLAALISISLGIFNLLPIYPLDGGQIMVALAEMLRGGRRLSFRVQNLVGMVGFSIVLVIFGGVLLVDFTRFTRKQPTLPPIVSAPESKTPAK